MGLGGISVVWMTITICAFILGFVMGRRSSMAVVNKLREDLDEKIEEMEKHRDNVMKYVKELSQKYRATIKNQKP